MSQIKDNKPRKKTLKGGSYYAHARYIADALCDQDTPKDLQEAAHFGLTEICLLLGLEMPAAAPTPKAWKVVKQTYIEMRRVIQELAEKRTGSCYAELRFLQLTDDELHSIPGIVFQAAEQLSELLHHLWCRDNSEGYAKNPDPPGSYNNFAARRSPAYILRQLKELQHTRHLIEEYGQARVLEAAKARLDLGTRAHMEIHHAIENCPLDEFIKGTHFRATLTPDIGKR